MLLVCASATKGISTTTSAMIKPSIDLYPLCIVVQNSIESENNRLTVCKYRIFNSLYKIFCVTSGENYAFFAIFCKNASV